MSTDIRKSQSSSISGFVRKPRGAEGPALVSTRPSHILHFRLPLLMTEYVNPGEPCGLQKLVQHGKTVGSVMKDILLSGKRLQRALGPQFSAPHPVSRLAASIEIAEDGDPKTPRESSR